MNDPLPLPPLPEPSKPAVDPLKPGAGGWLPSPATVAAIGGLGVTLGALTPVLPLPWNCISGAIGGGLVFFAAKSAGPRSL
jgi:hypothetical protein